MKDYKFKKNIQATILSFCFVALTCPTSFASFLPKIEAREGLIFELDNAEAGKKFAFKQKFTKLKNGQTEMLNQYFNEKGQLAVLERLRFNQNGFVSYFRDHRQIKEKSEILRQGAKVVFRHTRRGQTKEREDDFQSNSVIGPLLEAFLVSKWDQLMAGEEVDFDLAVPERRQFVGFEAELKDIDKPKKEVILVLEPSNPIIAAFVGDFEMSFDPEKKRVLRAKGQALPKIKKGNSFRSFDSRSVYTYPEAKDDKAEGS